MTEPLVTEWLINNAPLETLACRISVDEGLKQTPEARDSDVVVPGMDGELDLGMDPTAPRRSFGPGKIVFTGWVQGVDPDTGRLGWGDSWEMYERRCDELIDLFSPRRLVIDHVRPDGVRRAVGKRVGVIEPRRERTSPILGRWQVEVRLPSPFWAGVEDVTISTPPGGVASGGAIPLGALGAGNAPIPDCLLTFGPGSNPTLVQSGTYFAYDGIIASGRQLLVDTNPAAPSVGSGAGTSWTPLDSNVRFGPSPRWFDLDPSAGALTLNHTGGGSMFCSVTARPKYQTS